MSITKIMACGLGGGGSNILESFKRQLPADVAQEWKWLLIDTNPDALLVGSSRTEGLDTLAIGPEGMRGSGCDPKKAREAFGISRDQVAAKLQGMELVFTFATFGKGTGTGTLTEFVKLCKQLNIMPVVVVALPSVEGLEFGAADRNFALTALRELEKLEVRFVQIDNTAIFTTPELRRKDHTEARAELDSVVAKTVNRGLVQFFLQPAQVDLEDFEKNVLQGIGRLKPGVGTINLAGGEEKFSDLLDKAWQQAVGNKYYEIGAVGSNAMLIRRGPWTTEQLQLLRGKILGHTASCGVRFRILEGHYPQHADSKDGEFIVLFATDSPYDKKSAKPVEQQPPKSLVVYKGGNSHGSVRETAPLRTLIEQASVGEPKARAILQRNSDSVAKIDSDSAALALPKLLRLYSEDELTIAAELQTRILTALAKDPALIISFPVRYTNLKGRTVVIKHPSLQELQQAAGSCSLRDQNLQRALTVCTHIWQLWGEDAVKKLFGEAVAEPKWKKLNPLRMLTASF